MLAFPVTNAMTRAEAHTLIRTAFRGVCLDGGVSLRQAEVRDNWGRGVTEQEYRALPAGEVTDDWEALPLETLERYPLLAHLDARGFRYYIPAFMASVLECYEASSMRVISTLLALYPKQDERWDYHMEHYSLLTPGQRSAITGFLSALPALAELEAGDGKVVDRALRNYWREYL
jgi:hypothetical protein